MGGRHMSTRAARRLGVSGILVAVVMAAGCGGGGEDRETPAPAGQREMGTMTLTIQNNNFNAVTVYALWPGAKRLGRVEGKTERSFTVQIEATDVRFEGRLQTGSPATIGPLAALPGREYTLVIPPGN